MAKLPKFKSVEQLQKLCDLASRKSRLESAIKSDEVKKIVKSIKEQCVERASEGFMTMRTSISPSEEIQKAAVVESLKNSGFTITTIMGASIFEISWAK
ncbi:MAG: hypothetical protein V1661_03520 [bacterium]